MSRTTAGRVALVSLEAWDDVWRRNQWFAHELVGQELAREILFIEPPDRALTELRARQVERGVIAITPPLRVPKRMGGLRFAARAVARELKGVNAVWINDPVLGQHLLRHAPALYDVTDDWRQVRAPRRITRAVQRAENRLAGSCRTVVCSTELQRRWLDRYNIRPVVVNNGIDIASWASVDAVTLPGAGPHVGYVGTMHEQRLDTGLLEALARREEIGTLHLVGPDALSPAARLRLGRLPKVVLHGPVPGSDVAAWTCAMDVLVCPHVVTPFTLSLDAIKSYEYLASSRPIVATPTSGFQLLQAPGLLVAEPEDFPAAVVRSLGRDSVQRALEPMSWSGRARQFAAELAAL